MPDGTSIAIVRVDSAFGGLFLRLKRNAAHELSHQHCTSHHQHNGAAKATGPPSASWRRAAIQSIIGKRLGSRQSRMDDGVPFGVHTPLGTKAQRQSRGL